MIALRRSIAVRLAALFFLLFAGAIGAAFAASYWFVRAEIVSRMRADLVAKADAIVSRLRTQSPEIALSSETGRRVAAVFDASGALVAGQPGLSPVVGWREIAAGPLHLDEEPEQESESVLRYGRRVGSAYWWSEKECISLRTRAKRCSAAFSPAWHSSPWRAVPEQPSLHGAWIGAYDARRKP